MLTLVLTFYAGLIVRAARILLRSAAARACR